MKRTVRNEYILIMLAIALQWLFAALTGTPWHPFIIIGALTIFVITEPGHIWIWQVVIAGIILDVTSTLFMGSFTIMLVIAFAIARNLHKLIIRNINAGTVLAQSIFVLLLSVGILFTISRSLELLHDSQNIFPLSEFMSPTKLSVEIVLMAFSLPFVFRWWLHHKNPDALYVKKSLQ